MSNLTALERLMLAALEAQVKADKASMSGPNDKGYEHWQELENTAKEAIHTAIAAAKARP